MPSESSVFTYIVLDLINNPFSPIQGIATVWLQCWP